MEIPFYRQKIEKPLIIIRLLELGIKILINVSILYKYKNRVFAYYTIERN